MREDDPFETRLSISSNDIKFLKTMKDGVSTGSKISNYMFANFVKFMLIFYVLFGRQHQKECTVSF